MSSLWDPAGPAENCSTGAHIEFRKCGRNWHSDAAIVCMLIDISVNYIHIQLHTMCYFGRILCQWKSLWSSLCPTSQLINRWHLKARLKPTLTVYSYSYWANQFECDKKYQAFLDSVFAAQGSISLFLYFWRFSIFRTCALKTIIWSDVCRKGPTLHCYYKSHNAEDDSVTEKVQQ